MGKSREEKALYAELLKAIQKQNDPASNPYQQFLGNEALAGANFLKSGEFGHALPKGMYFNFQMPSEANEQYKKFANVNQGGTFALAQNGNDGARTKAQGLQGQYLQDKFARDASQNYQNNIADAGTNIRSGLAQAAGANSQNQSAVIGALGNLYSTMPKKQGFNWGSLLGAGASIASSFI